MPWNTKSITWLFFLKTYTWSPSTHTHTYTRDTLTHRRKNVAIRAGLRQHSSPLCHFHHGPYCRHQPEANISPADSHGDPRKLEHLWCGGLANDGARGTVGDGWSGIRCWEYNKHVSKVVLVQYRRRVLWIVVFVIRFSTVSLFIHSMYFTMSIMSIFLALSVMVYNILIV